MNGMTASADETPYGVRDAQLFTNGNIDEAQILIDVVNTEYVHYAHLPFEQGLTSPFRRRPAHPPAVSAAS